MSKKTFHLAWTTYGKTKIPPEQCIALNSAIKRYCQLLAIPITTSSVSPQRVHLLISLEKRDSIASLVAHLKEHCREVITENLEKVVALTWNSNFYCCQIPNRMKGTIKKFIQAINNKYFEIPG